MSPIERRSGSHQARATLTAVAAVVVLVGAVAAFVLINSSDGNVDLQLGDAVFNVGNASDRAEGIAADGPRLYPDVSGSGQRRPLFVDHEGDDPEQGWVAFDAKVPDSPADCFVEYLPDEDTYRDQCTGDEFPGGDGLPQYEWRVDGAGDLLVDLDPGDDIGVDDVGVPDTTTTTQAGG